MQIRGQRIGRHQARQHVVDRHIVGDEFARDRGARRGQGGARAVAMREADLRELHEAHGDVDDAPEAALGHPLGDALDQAERRERVLVVPAQPILAGERAEIGGGLPAPGIGDQDVRLGAGREHRFARRLGGEIAGHDRHLGAVRGADLLRGRLERRAGARDQRQRDALTRQAEGAGATQPFGCRADDCLATGDAEIHSAARAASAVVNPSCVNPSRSLTASSGAKGRKGSRG